MYKRQNENYVVFHTSNKRILQRQTLTKAGLELPDYFIRIHKSYIISLEKIEQLERDFVVIQNRKLPIGRTYKANFLAAIAKTNKEIN